MSASQSGVKHPSVAKWFRRFIACWFFSSAGLLSYYVWTRLSDPETLPFKHVELTTKSSYVSEKVLKQFAERHLNGGFFSLNIAELRRTFLEMPWVSEVVIQRRWPDTLRLEVVQKKPLARWGAHAVVDSHGARFYPSLSTIPEGLPLLQGPEFFYHQLVSRFQRFDDAASILGLHVKALRLSPRLAWEVTLSDGVTMRMGREKVDARFSRFLKLYPRVISNPARVDYVDLRYANGFSVHWSDHLKKSHAHYKNQLSKKGLIH